MNCPNCKNPVIESAAVCEWCGVNISSTKTMSETEGFIMNVEIALCGNLRRVTFEGVIEIGRIKVGDEFAIICPSGVKVVNVCKGIWKAKKYYSNGEASGQGERIAICSSLRAKEVGLSFFWKTIHPFNAKIIKP
jgi:translation elongation factor EF-Tu-like GTPase